VRTFLRIFFHFLYHQFAFAYDLVAAAVSFGHWKNWIQEVIPFITGTRILEIGHGPGHLQRILLTLRHGSGQARNLDTVALDESSAMGRLAKRNLNMSLRAERSNLQDRQARSSGLGVASSGSALLATTMARGLAQQLPFASGAFDTIIATFPTEYFTAPETLSEVKRCLSDGGRFVVLPVAMPKSRFLSWLFKVTRQVPSDAAKAIREKMEEPFIEAGFDVETHVIELKSGTLIVIVATISQQSS
jgi:ubiquinone/menaquinone biosynthesis C-methylase UbiE